MFDPAFLAVLTRTRHVFIAGLMRTLAIVTRNTQELLQNHLVLVALFNFGPAIFDNASARRLVRRPTIA